MTTREKTFTRWNPLSKWNRENLPDSNTGFYVTDIDYVYYNSKKKRLMLIEVKTYGYNVSNWQKEVLNNLHKWLQIGITEDEEWEYRGCHFIKFDGFDFSKQVYLDNKIITEDELIKFLSMNG